MASVGALLDHLVRERAASDYDDDGIPGLDVRDIHILSLQVEFIPEVFMTSLN
jgi:DNA mismatch repair protein MSH5